MDTCQVCATPLPADTPFCHVCGTQVSSPGAGESPSGLSRRAEEILRRLRSSLGDEYEIERELGRGGMGIVYLAREIALDRYVALKVLPPTLAFDESLVERFVREARLAARLDHPNIIPIYRVGRADDVPYFVMKYVSGGSLQTLLKNTPRLSLTEARRILAACAHAFGYAHSRNVIHRDVKPANILLDTGGRVYVTDLGIAKALSAESALTRSGAMVGTPMYMSPEQCRGSPADARSDQYALGLVGYQMLAGKLPFEEGKSTEGILYDRCFTEPEPLETARPELPETIRYAIRRALAREPEDRFPSMAEFAQAFLGEEARLEAQVTTPVGHTPRATRPPTPSPKVSPPGGRRAGMPIPLWGLLAATAAAAGWWFWIRPAPQEEPRTTSVPPVTADTPATSPEALQPAAPVGAHWRLAGSLPSGAALTLDGEQTSASEGTLESGEHTVRVTAPGHEPWQETRLLTAGSTWEIHPDLKAGERPPPPPTTRRPTAQRSERSGRSESTGTSEPPDFVLSAIRVFLQDGRQLHSDGRYLEAAQKYRRGLESVANAESTWKGTGALAQLRRELRNALRRAALACRLEGQSRCPQP